MHIYLQVALLSRIHHRNLVPLIGYCEEEHHRMLVYEYMHNGTLRDHIHGMLIVNQITIYTLRIQSDNLTTQKSKQIESTRSIWTGELVSGLQKIPLKVKSNFSWIFQTKANNDRKSLINFRS